MVFTERCKALRVIGLTTVLPSEVHTERVERGAVAVDEALGCLWIDLDKTLTPERDANERRCAEVRRMDSLTITGKGHRVFAYNHWGKAHAPNLTVPNAGIVIAGRLST